MEIKRNGSQPSSKGPAEWFTGNVHIEPLHQADAPARVGISKCHIRAWRPDCMAQPSTGSDFDRDRWQWTGTELGWSHEEIQPGDVVWCPPGEKHWHGAAPTTAMTHISIVEWLDGKSADWMEHVSDEQYQAK